jgi:hypothetical protein
MWRKRQKFIESHTNICGGVFMEGHQFMLTVGVVERLSSLVHGACT